MNSQHYTASFSVAQSPAAVFAAVTNPRGWWSEEIKGPTDRLGAEFNYHYQDIHRARFRITEFVPNTKVVWHVLANEFNFVKDKTEWTGTDVVFEIADRGDGTELRFTHLGLTPTYECYDVCSDAWGHVRARQPPRSDFKRQRDAEPDRRERAGGDQHQARLGQRVG